MTLASRRQIMVINGLGLHLRPADKFARHARQFQADIRVAHNGKAVNGKSILDLLTLAAACGGQLDLEANGHDAEEAIAALCALVDARFYETDDGEEAAPSA